MTRRRRFVSRFMLDGSHGATLTLTCRHAECLDCLETTPAIIIDIHEIWQEQYQILTSGTPRQAGPALRARRHPARSS